MLPWEIASRSARSAVVSSRPTRPVGSGRIARRRFRYERPDGQEQGEGDREHEPEHRGHRDDLDEHAAEQEADGGAAPGRGHEQPDRTTGARPWGARSRASPTASGPSPAPRPCSTLPAINPVSEPDSAQTSEPIANAPTERSRKRRFPYMSPRRPAIVRRGDGREEEAGQQPCGRRERGPVRLLDRRQDRDDHELLEAEVERADGQHPGDGGSLRGVGTTPVMAVVTAVDRIGPTHRLKRHPDAVTSCRRPCARAKPRPINSSSPRPVRVISRDDEAGGLPPSSTRRLQRTSGSSPSMQGASGAGVGAARRLQVQNAALTSRSAHQDTDSIPIGAMPARGRGGTLALRCWRPPATSYQRGADSCRWRWQS